MLERRYINFTKTMAGSLYSLFDFDFYNFYNKKSLIYKDPFMFKKRWIDFFNNFFKAIYNEIYIYFIIFKDYFMYSYISFYFMFILVYSDINIYYFFFKKILLCLYLIYIFIYSYFKFLYFYILPNYFFNIFIYIY